MKKRKRERKMNKTNLVILHLIITTIKKIIWLFKIIHGINKPNKIKKLIYLQSLIMNNLIKSKMIRKKKLIIP